MTPNGEILLQAVNEEDVTGFLKIINDHHCKDSSVDLKEILSTFSKNELDILWDRLENNCISSILLAFNDEEENLTANQEKFEKGSQLLSGIVTIAAINVQQDDPYISVGLLQVAVVLHGILRSLPDSLDKLKNKIVDLCEIFWTKSLEGKENVINDAILFLINRTLSKNSLRSDFKKVWTLHECLKNFDFESDNSKDLQELLQKCIASSEYLKIEEGRKFLAYLFSLDINFIEDLHRAIKDKLTFATSEQGRAYGEIYMRAWRSASGTFKEKIESYCIQDLMYDAIHISNKQLSSVLVRLLGYLHHQKKQSQVCNMLQTLYGPILWRSLKVANAIVRANSAKLFFDAFPLENPNNNAEESEAFLQKQFDYIEDLLDDSSPHVRNVTIYGICHIFSLYWEMIPAAVIRVFLLRLFDDFAFDASAVQVRVAVFQGLSHLLENPLSHAFLKSNFSKIKNCFHDVSEKVRMAFLDMLHKLKFLKSFQYWDIVPLEDLLVRLSFDSPPVCRRIVSLIFSGFHPLDKPEEALLERSIILIQMHRLASRKFYQYAAKHLDLNNSVSFLLLLCRCLKCYIRNQLKELNDGDENLDENSQEIASGLSPTTQKDNCALTDPDVVAGIIDVICIIWDINRYKLLEPKNVKLQEKLHLKYCKLVPMLYKFFKGSSVYESLLYLLGFLPPTTIPILAKHCVCRLRSLNANSRPEDYSAIIKSLCSWGWLRDITDILSEWMSTALCPKKTTPVMKTKKKKIVKFREPHEPQPSLACDILNWMLQDPVCRAMLTKSHRTFLVEIWNQTENVLKFLQIRLNQTNPISIYATDEMLEKAFHLFCKITVLLDVPDTEPHIQSEKILDQLLTWAEIEILSTPIEVSCNDSRQPEESLHCLKIRLLKFIIELGCNLILTGYLKDTLSLHFVEFIHRCLLTAEYEYSILLEACKFTYLLLEDNIIKVSPEDCKLPEYIVIKLTTAIVIYLENLLRSIQDDKKCALGLKSILHALFSSLIRNGNQFQKALRDAIFHLVKFVVKDLTMIIQKEHGYEEAANSVSELPFFSAYVVSISFWKKTTGSLFMEEINELIKSDCWKDAAEGLAVAVLINVLAKDLVKKREDDDVKGCLSAAQCLINKIKEATDGDCIESTYLNKACLMLKEGLTLMTETVSSHQCSSSRSS